MPIKIIIGFSLILMGAVIFTVGMKQEGKSK